LSEGRRAAVEVKKLRRNAWRSAGDTRSKTHHAEAGGAPTAGDGWRYRRRSADGRLV